MSPVLVKEQSRELSRPFVTAAGRRLERPVVAYEDYGRPDGPVVFLAHGGLSNHHAAGRYRHDDPQPGWWDGLVGPGKPFDTDRYRVLATNALGSMFGTTGPRSLDPATGRPYGPDFPVLELEDAVRFQRAFLDELGVGRVAVMAGPSMGSLHTLTMAALYPDFVSAAVAVATAGRTPPPALMVHTYMMNLVRRDPGFRGGHYDATEPLDALRSVFQLSKFFYCHEEAIKRLTWDRVPDGPGAQVARAASVAAYLEADQEARIRTWDPNSLIAVLTAINTHDLGRGRASYAEGVQRIRCPVLLMNIDTDGEFQPRWAEEVAALLNAQWTGHARVRTIASAFGHLGCLLETEQLGRHLREFLGSL